MFYNVTPLYFETAQTDALREPGFSKDGKTAESQVVLGLLVSEGGYPLSYSLFNGSQCEGFTMIPMIDDFKQRFTYKKRKQRCQAMDSLIGQRGQCQP